MNKRTKLTIGIIAMAAAIVGINYTSGTLMAKTEGMKVFSYHADYKVYEDIEELESQSPIIVNAKFTGERETILGDSVTDFIPFSKSKVKIKKVMKGDLEEEDNVLVFEPAAIDSEKNEFVTVEGYNLMNEEGEYTLFLRDTPKENSYQIVGMYQGKYDHSINDNVKNRTFITDFEDAIYDDVANEEIIGDNLNHFQKLKDKVVQKYNWE
ncbi:hypothetical protein [Brevibacillus parabrevis]|uniref:hypothetical protein n=1 Tax=Brevibacillus parabrevis TaxID=54914 RepID=UPI001F626006|nr:hypothetical protein [Brevibacillus parabrevis]MDR5001990.1 hypothetical protein [Brevibacillus parabrevis]